MKNKSQNGWETKRLDEVATITMGQSPSSTSYNYEGYGVPFLQGKPSVIDGMGVAVPNQWTTEPTRIVDAGTALMTVRAPVGELFKTEGSLCLGRGLAGIKANIGVDQTYLNYFIQYSKKQFDTMSQGSTFTAINSGDVKSINILMPESKVQKYFGDILNTIDKSIFKTDQILQKTEVLKQGMMQDLLTQRSNKLVVKLCDIADVTSSKRVMVSDYTENGIPFYRSTEIIKKSKNIPFDNPLYISNEKYNYFNKRFGVPKKGDILITAVGTIGSIYLVQDENFYFKDGNLLWIKKIKDSVLPEYLKMTLSTKLYHDKLNQIAGGSSQKALTIEKLNRLDIFTPSILDQKKLISVFESIDNKQIYNIKELNKLRLLKKGLMNDIFNQKIQIK